LIPETDVSM